MTSQGTVRRGLAVWVRGCACFSALASFSVASFSVQKVPL